MIYINETFPDKDSVAIQVDGLLDSESLPLLKNVCHRRIIAKKRVFLHLEGLVNSCREAMEYLREIEPKVTLVDPPEFMGLWALDHRPRGRRRTEK